MLGLPIEIYPYPYKGLIYEVRARYEKADGGKEILPWYFTSKGERWVNRQAPGPRPLYKYDDLMGDVDAPVLFVEGERTANSGGKLFGDYVATTSSGGCKQHNGTEYEPLKGRKVVIWPDNDEPGRGYAEAIAKHAHDAGAISIAIVDVPREWPATWDLADEPPSDSVDYREMIAAAKAWTPPAPSADSVDADAAPAKKNAQTEELEAITAAVLLKTPAPPRKWHVEPWIPANDVTLVAGDGGVGKSTLLLQLAWASAAGRQWLGMDVRRCSSLYISCEDDEDEVHWRLEQLYKAEPLAEDLDRLHILSFAGKDAIISTPNAKTKISEPTERFGQIELAIQKYGIGLLILDSLADVFGGEEMSRSQARSFIQLLRGLALRNQCTIVVLAHPSVDGMKTERGYSGNTHWNNSVRSRLYFVLPGENTPKNNGEDDEKADPDERVLKLMKTNRARRGVELKVRWENGRFVLSGARAIPSVDQAIADEDSVSSSARSSYWSRATLKPPSE